MFNVKVAMLLNIVLLLLLLLVLNVISKFIDGIDIPSKEYIKLFMFIKSNVKPISITSLLYFITPVVGKLSIFTNLGNPVPNESKSLVKSSYLN
jgi:hypothetical protein